MFGRKPPVKPEYDPNKAIEALPEVALAAIVSSKKQKDVNDFMAFFLNALERNSDWINNVIGKQVNFRCALMVGSGPNRLQLQEVIYPSTDDSIKFEVELKDSDDYDKVAVVALLKLTNVEINHLLKYLKHRLHDNPELIDDLQKGKTLGVNFAMLRPITDKQYRIMERIIIGSSLPKNIKKKKDEKSFTKSLLKKSKKVI